MMIAADIRMNELAMVSIFRIGLKLLLHKSMFNLDSNRTSTEEYTCIYTL